MGFPTDFFPVLFAISRTAGWLAHWVESLKEHSDVFRPLQSYEGHSPRKYIPIQERKGLEREPFDMTEKLNPRKNIRTEAHVHSHPNFHDLKP